MFDNQRYLTRGISTTIPPPLQTLLWNLMKQYDMLPATAHFSEPLFFASIDLMKWKDYGIIILLA